MEGTRHLFEDAIYLISNRSVARNPMFTDKKIQQYFLEKMEIHLSPLATVLAYNLGENDFRLLVKLKERTDFEQHFLAKRRGKEFQITGIPDSTYIFSQAMANLQVSFVKHFNFIHERSGTLMAGRFKRQLVETEDEKNELIKSLNKSKVQNHYTKRWLHQASEVTSVEHSLWLYEGVKCDLERRIEMYVNGLTNNLGSYFRNLPPKKLDSTKSFFINKYNLLFGPIP